MEPTDEMVEAAKTAYNASMDNPRSVECARCSGKGYHHGFGEDGADPDWCSICGGGGVNFPDDEEDKAMRAALTAALAVAPKPRVRVKPLDLPTILRDAFLAGRGLARFDALSEADQAAWAAYDADGPAFQRILSALEDQS